MLAMGALQSYNGRIGLVLGMSQGLGEPMAGLSLFSSFGIRRHRAERSLGAP
jgi:hypothetical protein